MKTDGEGSVVKREINITWSIEDVLEVRPDLTDEQAMEVLEQVENNHDADVGVSWETLEMWADSLFPDRNALDS